MLDGGLYQSIVMVKLTLFKEIISHKHAHHIVTTAHCRGHTFDVSNVYKCRYF